MIYQISQQPNAADENAALRFGGVGLRNGRWVGVRCRMRKRVGQWDGPPSGDGCKRRPDTRLNNPHPVSSSQGKFFHILQVLIQIVDSVLPSSLYPTPFPCSDPLPANARLLNINQMQ